MDELKEVHNRFKGNANVVKIEVKNGKKIIKKYIIYNFLGIFISNLTIASFLLWNNNENINYYLVDNKYLCIFINETFYKVKVEVSNNHILKYKKNSYEFVNN